MFFRNEDIFVVSEETGRYIMNPQHATCKKMHDFNVLKTFVHSMAEGNTDLVDVLILKQFVDEVHLRV